MWPGLRAQPTASGHARVQSDVLMKAEVIQLDLASPKASARHLGLGGPDNASSFFRRPYVCCTVIYLCSLLKEPSMYLLLVNDTERSYSLKMRHTQR